MLIETKNVDAGSIHRQLIQQIPSTNNFIRKEILDNIPSAPGLPQPTRVPSSALKAFLRCAS